MQKLTKYNFEKKREVKDYVYLQQNYLKLFLYYFCCVITAFVVYIVVNSIQNLKRYIYDEVNSIDDADYIFLILESDNREVIKINHIKAKISPNNPPSEFRVVNYANKTFYYSKKKNSFRILGNRFAHKINKNPKSLFSLLEPLDETKYNELREFYGVNNFIVDQKTFFTHLFEYLTVPIHLFNVCASIYFVTYEPQYAYAIKLTFYLSLMFSIRRWEYVKEIKNVNKICKNAGSAIVYRRINNKNKKITIEASEITVGDIVEINNNQIINFDCIIFNGTCVVDQSTLTGETIPIIKRGIIQGDPIKSYNKILAGSKCLQKKSKKVFCIVTAIGFDSFQGNLISSMTVKKLMPFKFYEDLTKLFSMFLAFFLLFLVFIFLRDIRNDSFNFDRILLMLVQICIHSFPLSLYVSLFLAERVVSYKLSKSRIKKASTDYIVKAGRMNLVCFDKTGTLTEDGMRYKGVILPKKDSFGDISKNIETDSPLDQQRVTELMACCNSLDVINGKILGDPLELEIFKFTNFTFKSLIEKNEVEDNSYIDDSQYFKKKEEVEETLSFTIIPPEEFKELYSIEHDHLYNIKRYIHFDSTRRRMSIIINNPNKTSKYLVFMKGAPEVVPDHCRQDSLPQNYKTVTDNLSKGGLRLLAMCYKEIDTFEGEIKEIESDMIFLGLLVFVNPLKKGVNRVITDLHISDIKSIMITGDALNTAVHVGYASGIVEDDKCIWIGQLNKSKLCVSWYQTNKSDINKANEKEHIHSQIETIIKENSVNSHISSIYDRLKTEFTMKLQDCLSHKYILALDGDTIEYLIESYIDKEPVFLELIFKYTLIFGRTNPYQKKLIVKYHKELNSKKDLTVGFVGDGANDAEALQEADIGLSLGNKLSSMVASYYTPEDKIEKIKTLSIEGKFALATSIEILSFSVYINMTNNLTVLFMGLFGLNYTAYEFIGKLSYFFPFYVLLAITGSSNKMTYHYPEPSFLRKSIFMPFIVSTLVMIFLTLDLYFMLKTDITFKEVSFIVFNTKKIINSDHHFFQNKILSLYWLFRSVFQALSVSIGAPFKKSIFTNIPCMIYAMFLILYNLCKFLESYFNIYWYQYYLVKIVRWPNMSGITALKYLSMFILSGLLTMSIYQVVLSYYMVKQMLIKQKIIEKKDKIHQIHRETNKFANLC